jgi:hypothetical protein
LRKLGLVSISAYITYSIGLEFECLEKLKSNNGDESELQDRAYKGEESDSMYEIKEN